MVCACVCKPAQSCTNSTRSGRVANGNLQSDKCCHDKQKAEPCESGGGLSPRQQPETTNQPEREGGRGGIKEKGRMKGRERQIKTNRKEGVTQKTQEADYYSQCERTPPSISVVLVNDMV